MAACQKQRRILYAPVWVMLPRIKRFPESSVKLFFAHFADENLMSRRRSGMKGLYVCSGCINGTQVSSRRVERSSSVSLMCVFVLFQVHTKFHCRQAHAPGSDTSCLAFSYDGVTLASRGGQSSRSFLCQNLRDIYIYIYIIQRERESGVR